MEKRKTLKRELLEWGILLGIPAILYLGGWHTEVLGRMQQAVLFTGIMKPDTEVLEQDYSPADYELSLATLDNQALHLSELKGKVIFMNFWATWCPPCIAEMPNIHSLYKKVAGNDIEFIMINLDEDPKKARRFLSKKDYSFPVYRLNSPLPQAYYSQSIPATFVISPEGKIVSMKQGMADYDNKEFREFLLELSETK
jgi:thiol-disulfide isomerase/thioredoxin